MQYRGLNNMWVKWVLVIKDPWLARDKDRDKDWDKAPTKLRSW